MMPDTTDTAREPKLLPCPFCGSRAVFGEVIDREDANWGGVFITCSGCPATTDLRFPIKEDVHPLLVEAWNRRVLPPDAQPKPEAKGLPPIPEIVTKGPLPDCMMPDGAEPCIAYQRARDAIEIFREEIRALRSDRDAARQAGVQAGWDAAIEALRKHADIEAVARKIESEYVEHARDAADWLAANRPVSK